MSSFSEPHPTATVSHWIASNTGPNSLHNHGREDELPDKADFAIVGAGIAGALLAYHLAFPEDEQASSERRKIVILEGKEVCNAATGRNGGHFAPATFASLSQLIKPISRGGKGIPRREAVEILQHEWDNYMRNVAVIKKHNLEDKVDLWQGTVMTVYNTEQQLCDAQEGYRQWREALAEFNVPDKSDHVFCVNKEDAAKVSRVKGAVGYSTRKAGSVHPHKLTTEIIKLCLASENDDVSLYTSTPVLSISKEPNEAGEIELKTDRGSLLAKKVILCTNAHTPHLFPDEADPLRTFIYPVRGQMGLYTPPTTFSGEKSLAATYGFPVGYCATSTGGIVVGVTINEYLAEGIYKPEDFIGNSDDSELLPDCTEYLKTFMTETMNGWDERGIGEGLTRTWMGVQGITLDRFPLIGPVPDRPGLYITAGYNGHGMSTTHTCARAISRFIQSGQWAHDFPEPYKLTKERLNAKIPPGGYVEHYTSNRRTDFTTLDS